MLQKRIIQAGVKPTRRLFYELSFRIKVHGNTSEETSLPSRMSTSFCAAIPPMFLSS